MVDAYSRETANIHNDSTGSATTGTITGASLHTNSKYHFDKVWV